MSQYYRVRRRTVYLNERPAVPSEISDRQICHRCGKVRGYSRDSIVERFETVDETSDGETEVTYRRYTGVVRRAGRWYGGDRFCTLACCERFAAAAVRAGYVLKSRKVAA